MKHRRPILALAALLVLQLGVALAIHFLPSEPAAAANSHLVSADLKAVDHLVVAGARDAGAAVPAAKVELVKRDGHWWLPGASDAPADAAKVQALIDRLAQAERGLPIATSKAALARFRVADDDYERRVDIAAGGHDIATVFVGSSAGPRKAGTRTAADSAVYATGLAPYDLPVTASDWLDDVLLHRDPATIAGFKIDHPGHPALTLARAAAAPAPASAASGAAPAWSTPDAGIGQHLDAARLKTLVDAVANLRVDGVLGLEPPDGWLERVELRLTIDDGKGGSVVWTLAKAAKGDEYVLKASNHPWFLQVKSWNAQPLLDAAATDKLIVATSPSNRRHG